MDADNIPTTILPVKYHAAAAPTEALVPVRRRTTLARALSYPACSVRVVSHLSSKFLLGSTLHIESPARETPAPVLVARP